jgi:tetratricopeptide (TPR) repeat protein
MPPKAISFKANSIVYFKGDKGESVYILQKGQVSLNYLDIQTGQEMHDYVQTGEFFGVKAAFGKYPHDETAVVMVNSTVIQFSVDDFEQLLSSNSRIIMKMLKVFSNQLRRIHKQVRSLMSVDEQVDAEKGLYSVGEYYFNNKKHLQAADAFNRYLIYYPAGRFVALRDKGNYVEALKAFIILSKSNPDQKILTDFEAGICVFRLKKGNETIKHFTDILKRNPAHSRMGEALYYIGKSYLMLDDKEKAKSFLNKSSSLLDEGCPEQRDAVLLLEQLGGS